MNLFGFEVDVLFLVQNNVVVAYGWHFDKDKSRKHLEKIKEYHALEGRIIESESLETWLEERLRGVVIEGEKFNLPDIGYTNRKVYERIIEIPRGKVATYSEIARLSGVRFTEVLVTLMRNPFQVLIPCHRLLTNKGSLMGFYPLRTRVKRKLLELEEISI